MGTEYQKLLDAVENYYGRGSDQWTEIARYGLSADNCAEILKQTPNVNMVLSKDGSRVLSYSVGETSSLASQGAGAVVNSNTQVATLSKTAELKYPAQMTVESSGTVLAESGMKTVSTGATVKTVLGNVASGVVAVGCGVQLGALIDQTLYNANPEFWDSHNMSSLNPQTWDSLCSTENGKDIFNMVFGIDKDTGETQAYVDQNALAYICQYLVSQGAFDFETVDIIDENQTVGSITITGDMRKHSTRYDKILRPDHPNFKYTDYICYSTNTSAIAYYDDKGSTAKLQIMDCGNYTILSSDTNFNNHFGIFDILSGEFMGGGTIHIKSYTYNNKTVYYTIHNNTGQPHLYEVSTPSTDNQNVLAWLMVYGTYTTESTGGVSGITSQGGATLPSGITSDMTIPQVITQLQSLYPSLFDDAIYNDVVQEDGTTERIIYLPVAIPDSVPLDDTTGQLKPTGGVDLLQDDSVVDDNSPDDLIKTLIEIISTPDPYDPTKTPTDTDSNAPDTGDGTTPPIVLPTGSASALYSIYNPSQAEVNSFGSWLWSSNFVDQLKKIFNDPMQAIIGLHKVFATPSTSGTGTIKVGYLDSEISSKLVSNQYTSIDCGTIDLYEYFGNVLDYTETEIYIYLPFVGIVPLNVYDVMRSSINVKYKVDVLTGACLCSVNVTRDTAGGQLYTYSGNCAVQYPLSSGSYMGIVASALGVAGSVVGTIASGGAMLPLALGVGASALTSAKTRVEHSGSISGNAGAMGIKKPYIIIKRPQTAYANDFNYFNGIAQNEKVSLSTLSGFTKVKYVNLEGIQATSNEMEMIENELIKGVLI